MEKKIRVMVIDDSPSVCALLKQRLDGTGGIEVVATAPNPYEARDQVVLLNPDVIILDIEMPGMDGITFLEKLTEHFPKPVIILSSFTPAGSGTAVRALEAGAFDVLSKTEKSLRSDEFLADITEKIRAASVSRVVRGSAGRTETGLPDLNTDPSAWTVLMGASTGGTEALKRILTRLPSVFPPILIVQHMPPYFTAAFADHLSAVCRIRVKEAAEGDRIVPGHAFIAPGDRHLILREDGRDLLASLSQGPRVHYQRPSVDILFKSAAGLLGEKAIGVILTGMGRDGAEGLLAIRKAGGRTLAQDEESSVVYGMPDAAVKLGAAEEVAGLDLIPEKIVGLMIQKK